ncbi:KilA-N domain-containing protein [Pseudodesulfovibrio karagichevae]|uniref:KilA-N domain-containing protein n=1 Tax=Pseudodesulfovibrio karagichevae TaxID=3239305 RepID=A0ABV4JXY8_9BACT
MNDGMVNMTNMWRACGGESRNRPKNWLANADTKRLVDTLGEKLRGQNPAFGNSALVKIYRGGNQRGGTYAHGDLGIAYAMYLSPDFHLWCIQKIRETGLVQISDSKLLVKLGEDGLPVEQTNFPAAIRHEEVMVFGPPILVAVLEGEEKYVSIRHICEAIGINTQMQQKRLKKDESFSHLLIDINVQHTSGAKATIMLPLD